MKHGSHLEHDNEFATHRRARRRFETKRDPVLPRRAFALRLLRTFGRASLLILVSLMLGMAGYHFIEELSWIDAFLNAAMILGGMGPVAPLQSSAGKLFAGCYALYSGLVVIVAAGVLFTPIFHRIIHKFHAEAAAHEDGNHPSNDAPPPITN